MPLALAIKIRRRSMQLDQYSGRLQGRWRVAAIIFGEIGKSELGFTAALPQETGINFSRDRLGARHELTKSRLLEAQQHGVRLDFASLAMRRLHLQRGIAVREYCTDLEGAVFFVKNIHGGETVGGWEDPP